MYIPDPTEIGESNCENWADKNIVGDQFKCHCGEMCDLDDAQALSPDPYAIPVCPKCAEEYAKEVES